MRSTVFSVAMLAPILLVSSAARADADDLRIMAEPTTYTDVLDAFDDDDPFDFDVHVEYRRTSTASNIEREAATDSGRSSGDFTRVGESLRVVKQLRLGIDVGVFRDAMLSLGIPFVLSDEQSVEWTPLQRSDTDTATSLFGASGVFQSKPRSGVPGLDLGARIALTNQYRMRGWPTWVVLLESHIVTGDVIAPCAQATDCKAGITEGASDLKLGSRWSYRTRYVEPYFGLSYLWPFVTSGEELHGPNAGRAKSGAPPEEGELTLGVAIVPWEDRRRFQRFSVDLRGTVARRGAGREASPLFDALGTSDLLGDRFTGLSDVESRLRGGVEISLEMRAARYVRFRVSMGLAQSTPYLITTVPGCNGDIEIDPADSSIGSCDGVPFVPVIELPGNRFRVEGALTTDLRATASGHF